MRFTVIVTALFCLTGFSVLAQPKKGEFITASAGLGYVYTSEDIEVNSSGFYAQAEYVWSPLSWFGVRPYAGMIFSSGENVEKEPIEARVKSNAFLLGAKVRIAAPIPYVAPFVEAGFGMSAGYFETRTPLIDVQKSGLTPHFPFSLGVAVGRKHNIEIKLTYFEHYKLDQFNGAAAVGFTFPI
ncbi:hypothetical protein [Flavobacterium selenitireducens]|uniref:hypothetical protein n=1 Tax=Flavobacterium selenitireducens TaxID=2722704 RepID=UPI00168B4F5D|nr:hypothetical protein [Flavobacterium selenitireducens]MBD3581161.1 hypothetical protein [Flavobacterium selenitireducens]